MHGRRTGSDAGTGQLRSSAASDVDERSCGVGSLVGEQPQNGACDLDCMAAPAHRLLWAQSRNAPRFAATRVNLGGDDPRSDTVDGGAILVLARRVLLVDSKRESP